MKNKLSAVALVAGAFAFAAGMAGAQTSDSIRYFDRAKNKEETVKCLIQVETTAHVVFRQAGNTKDVSAADVIEVSYEKTVGAGNLATYRKAQRAEGNMVDPKLDADAHKKAFVEALAAYRTLQEEVKGTVVAQRHIHFAIARILAQRAEDDAGQAEPAVTELKKFLKQYPEGWQISHAAELLGHLQEAQGDVAGAQKTYEDLAARPEAPKEIKQKCDLLVAQMLIRGNKHEAARDRLEKMARSLEKNDPESARVQVYLAQCQVAAGKLTEAEAKLKGILAGNLDNAVKGLAYNALGDIGRQQGQPEQAFWNYLWVDVVFNQDKNEHAKALYYLSKLFVEVKNDPARALQCRDQLLKNKDFVGLDFQKLAAKEKGE